MFLVPACVALSADGLILFLHRSLVQDAAVHEETSNADEQGKGEFGGVVEVWWKQ